MSNESIIAVPPDVAKPETLKFFLIRLVEKLDEILGFRGDDAAASSKELQLTDLTLAQVATSLQETIIAVESIVETVEDNADEIEQNATDIDVLESYWTHAALSSTYYDFDHADWGTLVGNFEFAADGSLLSNTPYTASGGTIYRNFVQSIPTINGGVVQRLVVVFSSSTILVFQRAGDSFSEATTIGWVAL